MRFIVRSEVIVEAADEHAARRLASDNQLRSTIVAVEKAPYRHAAVVPPEWSDALGLACFGERLTHRGGKPEVNLVTFADVPGVWLTDARIMLMAQADWAASSRLRRVEFPNWQRAKSELRKLMTVSDAALRGDDSPKKLLNTNVLVEAALFGLIETIFPGAEFMVPKHPWDPVEAHGSDGMVAALMPCRWEEPTDVTLTGRAA